MLTETTITKLREMRLSVMANALKDQLEESQYTVTQGKGIDRQERRTRGKFPVSVMPEVCLPMTAPGLRSSLPFRDGEGGHLYV